MPVALSYQARRRVRCFASMFIELKQALATMRQTDERGRPVPFCLEATTCDEQRGTGGQNLVLTNWVLAETVQRANNEQRLRKTAAARVPVTQAQEQAEMVRVMNPENREIRQVCRWLITSFNNQLIIW